MGISIISFIIVLGVLVFFHELGHFLAARFFGVGVEKFSLGFGPKIAGRKVGMTDYRISAIPLGGYVKMVGEEPDAEIAPEDIHLSFTHKHVFKRIVIVAAGPLFNFFLAVAIFIGFFQVYGTYTVKPIVGEVSENMPAEKAGIKKGDIITAINGLVVESWTDMAGFITESNGKNLTLSIRRGESELDIDLKPASMPSKNMFGEDIKRYVIGIAASGDVVSIKLNPFQAFVQGFVRTYELSEMMVIGVVKLIKGDISKDNLGGPIMIAQMAGDQAKKGAASLLEFIALISINLGILNFLPIPVLDGGHLLFFIIEAVTGRPVSVKIREIAQQAGIIILVLLMVFAFYNDIMRFIIK